MTDNIIAFLQVVREQNMTRAAEKLHITQSTISYRIKNLEAELGSELIQRKKGTSAVALTKKGEEFLPIAEEWVSVYEKVEKFSKRQKQASICIAGPDSIHFKYKGIYKKIREKENVRLSIVTANSEDIEEIIYKSKADVGFSFVKSSRKELLCELQEYFPYVVVVLKEAGVANPVCITDLDYRKMIEVKGVGTDNKQSREIIYDILGDRVEPKAQYDNLSGILYNAEPGEWTIIPGVDLDLARMDDRICILELNDSSHCDMGKTTANVGVDLFRIEKTSLPDDIEHILNKYF